MIFKPLHFCFLAVLFVMSLGVSAHLAFTGHSFSLAVALASWSVFVVASMFVAVNAVVQYWFTTGTELGAHCSNTGSSAHYSYDPPQPRTMSKEINLIGAHAVADVIREQAGRTMPWASLDTCASDTAQAMRKALQGYQRNCSASTPCSFHHANGAPAPEPCTS